MHSIKIPINNEQWEVKRKIKVLQYHIRSVQHGGYFGHEEILSDNLDKRVTRARTLNNVTVYYINKREFLKQFP